MAAILFFIGCPKLTGSQSDKRCSSNRFHKQNPDYNVNLPTTVAAILFFVEGPKSIASKELPIKRPF